MAVQGSTQELTTTFYTAPGGSPVDPAGVTLTIKRNGDVVLGPLDAGDLAHDDVGLYRYDWAIPDDQTPGDYLAEWSGTLPGDTAPSIGYAVFTVTTYPSGDWVSLASFRASLANAGGAGSRTAAELPVDRLTFYLENAHTKVRGMLHRFTIPTPLDDAPDMLRGIVTDLAAYGATLEWNGSQPLEDRDPIVLRYTAALADLKALTTGQLVIDGVDADVPGEAGGEPEVYDQTPYLGIAEEWQADEDRIGGYARRGIVPGSHW